MQYRIKDPPYVGVDLDALDSRRGSVYVKKAKDGIMDAIVNAQKLVVSLLAVIYLEYRRRSLSNLLNNQPEHIQSSC